MLEPIIHIKGKTVKQITDETWRLAHEYGHALATPTDTYTMAPPITITLEEPLSEKGRYDYWDQASEQWYLDHFINETVRPPESSDIKYVFPYTYAWRMYYNDQGWGHVVQVINDLQRLNYSDLPLERPADLTELIKETYQRIHPAILLAVIHWLKHENLTMLLLNPELPKKILTTTRVNLLEQIAGQLNTPPLPIEATVASFKYNQLDVLDLTNHTPLIQDFQVVVKYDRKNEPQCFSTFRQQRELYADGSLQLDFSADIEYAKYISQQTGLPIEDITIQSNLLRVNPIDESEINNPDISVKEQLLSAVGGYEAKQYDIDTLLNEASFTKQINFVLKNYK